MDFDSTLRTLSQKAHHAITFAAAIAILISGHWIRKWVRDETLARQADLMALEEVSDRASQTLAETTSLRDLKARDISQFKKGLSKLTESKRSIYEAGLLLQEERRLLDKQWEMMTTYLFVDEETGKINLMRGEQALETYPFNYTAVKAVGGETKALPELTRIVSKERFANPERGKSEEINGQLQWEPPQVGTSVRANALGEYVMFTNSGLIIHGPPTKTTEHEEFTHYCLGLSLRVAQKLYANSFIGTKILFKPMSPKAREED